MKDKIKIAVVGAGASGLHSALFLLEDGYSNVHLYSKDDVIQTTSRVAGAVWWPYGIHDDENLFKWSKASLEVYKPLTRNNCSGVFWNSMACFQNEPLDLGKWTTLLQESKKYPVDLRKEFKYHTNLKVPYIDTSIYIPFVTNKVLSLGGTITKQKINAWSDLSDYDIILNCSGVGAKNLANDDEVYPIRGQILLVEKLRGIHDCIVTFENELLTHVFECKNYCVIGGTYEAHDARVQVDDEQASAMMQRAQKIYPQLKDAKIIEHKVGLRPGRPMLRLESEKLPSNQYVIHNYGHAGGGISIAPGCALDVLKLVNKIVGCHDN